MESAHTIFSQYRAHMRSLQFTETLTTCVGDPPLRGDGSNLEYRKGRIRLRYRDSEHASTLQLFIEYDRQGTWVSLLTIHSPSDGAPWCISCNREEINKERTAPFLLYRLSESWPELQRYIYATPVNRIISIPDEESTCLDSHSAFRLIDLIVDWFAWNDPTLLRT